MLANNGKGNFLVIIVFLQFVTCVAMFLDIPIARQVIGFIYFTFVPGFIIVKLLKINESSKLETILFSVGFSIAFLVLTGLLINEIGFLIGISRPLSPLPLTIVMNSLVLVIGVYVQLRTGGFDFRSPRLNKTSFYALLFLSLPILSIVGTMYLNVYGSSLILLGVIIVIALLFIIVVASRKLFPQWFYPMAVFLIAITLLYHSSLVSNYLLHFGSDVGGEYFAFKTTEIGGYWNSTDPYAGGEWTVYGRIHSMLSVTILPTIFSVLLNMNSIWMFKLVFPLIFAFVPLGLYQIWQTPFGRKYAFVSAFLFMALSTFYTEMLGLNKQIVAELFVVLLLLVVLNRKMKPVKRTICFMIFSFALVVSHYALAEIFLFLISLTLVFLIVLKRPARNVTVSMVVFFFVVMFIWYMHTSDSAVFESFVRFGDYVYNQLGDFLDPSSRGEIVLRGLGLEAPPTVWNSISRIFAYATQAFIAIGFVGLVKKRKGFHIEYTILTLLSMTILAALILIPGLANTLNMARFYHILLFLLAPLCGFGVKAIADLLSRQRREMMTSAILLVVLIPYFLFQTSLVYEVTGSDSLSTSLSKHRMSASTLYGHMGYIDDYGVFGAQWLSNTAGVGDTQIYADYFSQKNHLRVYGSIYSGYVEILSNTTQVKPAGLVYLNPLNTIQGAVAGNRYVWDPSELHFLNDLNKIYSNGGSEVYMNRE